MPRIHSIRTLLLAGTSAGLLLVLGPAAWFSYYSAEEEAEELFDARLATSARVLDALVAQQIVAASVTAPIVLTLPAPLENDASDAHDLASPLGHYYETKIAFQVRDAGGRLLARSASAHDAPFAPLVPGFSGQAIGQWNWRVFSLQSGGLWVQVAERHDVRAEMSSKLALGAIAPLLAGIPLLLVVLSLLVRYGLAPLAALVRQVAARHPASVVPVRLERTPSEIAPLVDALNGLLGRVREALERERRFTADAAHELRTPLAALKVHAQNAARTGSGAERAASLQRMLLGLERTIHLAEQMLAYSRAAAGGEGSRLERVALRPLLALAIDALQPLAHERGAAVQLTVRPADERLAVEGNRHKLSSLVTNLLDNALRYGPQGGRIEVALRPDGAGACVTITDQGPGIPADLRERVFESYFRLPGSAATGSGLGLSIVREVALAHGASVELREGPDGRGTSAVLRFPEVAAPEKLAAVSGV